MWTCTKRQGAAIPTTWCSLPGCDCNTAASLAAHGAMFNLSANLIAKDAGFKTIPGGTWKCSNNLYLCFNSLGGNNYKEIWSNNHQYNVVLIADYTVRTPSVNIVKTYNPDNKRFDFSDGMHADYYSSNTCSFPGSAETFTV
jgi:hypothetical protein